MNAQLDLALPLQPASDAVVINARCLLRIEEKQRVVLVAGLPVHHYQTEDAVAEAYAMVFLVESGFAQQCEVARAFGHSERTVRRYQARYAEGGMAGLGRGRGWRRGRRRIAGKRLRTIDTLKQQGLSNRAVAQRLGVTEKAIHKLVGPKPDKAEQLTLAAVADTETEPVTPSAARDKDAGPPEPARAEDHGGQTLPEMADGAGQPPMSRDSDAADRSLDRMLAYLGKLSDAASGGLLALLVVR